MGRLARDVVTEVRTLPLGVWAATLLFTGLTLFGTFLLPLYAIPDERFHTDMILGTMDGDGYPRVEERPLETSVVASGRLLRQNVRAVDPLPNRPRDIETTEGYYGTAVNVNPCDPDSGGMPDCVYAPTLTELAETYDFTGYENRMTAHAPGYYLLAGTTVAVVTAITGEDVPHDTQAWLYRLVSVLLMAPLPLLAALAGREVGADRATQVLLALSIGAITGIALRNAPLVNNDNLITPLLAAGIVVLLRIARLGPSRRRLVLLGALLGLGLFTKAFAMIFALVLPVSLLLVARGSTLRDRVESSVRSTVVVAVTSLAAGGWWVLRNLYIYGSVSENSFSRPDATEPFEASFLAWAVPWTEQVFKTGFQHIAHHLLARPGTLLVLVTLLLVLLMIGVRRLGWRTSTAASLPVVATFVTWAARMYGNYLRHGLIVATHARYYFPTIIGLLVVFGAGTTWLHHRFGRPARTVTQLSLLAFTMLAAGNEILHSLDRTWSPRPGSVAVGWERLQLWAPAPVAIAVIALVAVGLAAVALAVDAVRDGAWRTGAEAMDGVPA